MGLKGEIDLTEDQRRLLLALIERHLPDTDVWAYGSRVRWTSRPESDLDLVVFSGPDRRSQVSDLRDALTESHLPFRVDVLVWHDLPAPFCKMIDDEHAVLVEHCIHSFCNDDYPLVPIGEIVEIVGGGTPPTKDPSNFNGAIPWLTPRDLAKPHYRYVFGGSRTLSPQGLRRSSAHLVPRDTVLLSTRAPIGYTAIAACSLATNQGFRNLLPSNNISSAYLYYWLTANVPELQRHATGSTFAELSARALKEIRIPLPPLPVQRQLTQVLEVIDDKIALNRRLNVILCNVIESLFCADAISFRDPVRLGDIAIVHGGGTPSTSAAGYWNGAVPWYTVSDTPTTDDIFALRTERTLTPLGLANSHAHLLPIYTTVVSARGTVGNLACLATPMAINQSCFGIVSRSYPAHFLYWTIRTTIDLLRQRTHGTVFDTITRQTLTSLPLLVPPLAIATNFNDRVAPLAQQMIENLRTSQLLSVIRDRLLTVLSSSQFGRLLPDTEYKT